jgi:hypothetical protein
MGLFNPFGDLANPLDDNGSQFIRGLLAQGFNPFSANAFAPQQQQEQQPDPRAFMALAPQNAPQQPQQMQMLPGMSPVSNPDAPQPPPRPRGLLVANAGNEGEGEEDKPAPKTQPVQAAGGPPMGQAAPTLERPASVPQGLSAVLSKLGNAVGSIYGQGGPGDPMIAMGIGMMSKRRIGEGLQAGLDNMQRQSLVQGQTAQANQKLLQQQTLLQNRIQSIRGYQQQKAAEAAGKKDAEPFTPMSDAAVQALAQSEPLYNKWAEANLPGIAKENYATLQGPDGKTYFYDKSDPSSGAKVIGGQNAGGYTLADGRSATQAKTGDIVFGPDGKPVVLSASGNSTTVNMPPAEKASEQAFRQAQGKHWGEVLAAGDNAYKTIQNLDMLREAYRAGGSNIRSGPFATAILKGKQALNDIGLDVGGVPESEMVNKLGFELATQLTKAISNRPAQSEFLRALENVPGLSMSNAGAGFMIDVLRQKALHDAHLGQLITDPENRKNWSEVQKRFYESNPLVSPYTGQTARRSGRGGASEADCGGRASVSIERARACVRHYCPRAAGNRKRG